MKLKHLFIIHAILALAQYTFSFGEAVFG